MTAATTYEHITLDEKGVPVIAEANTQVVELVAAMRAFDWEPRELAQQFPHLTLGQIYSALAYYSDHQRDIDADLERRRELVDRMRDQAGQPPVVARLRQLRAVREGNACHGDYTAERDVLFEGLTLDQVLAETKGRTGD